MDRLLGLITRPESNSTGSIGLSMFPGKFEYSLPT